MVSIIIPVYNVFDYLDECLNSVVNQTYTDIEIIIINDGSTDGSDKKCEEWVTKDNRIVYISKNNEGVGPTRNLGIKIANGDYITFVDSDDWLDTSYIEKMYTSIINNNVNIVQCDWYKVINGNLNYVASNGLAGSSNQIEDIMMFGMASLCNIMTKRSLWLNNNIFMPQILFEDLAVYNLLLAVSKKIHMVNKPLYYYRGKRNGSICANINNYLELPNALKYLINQFKQRDLFKKYEHVLKRQAIFHLTKGLLECQARMDENQYLDVKTKYFYFMNNSYPMWNSGHDKSYVSFGSYNLGKIVHELAYLGDAFNRFNFSSIISVMSDKNYDLFVKHNNQYRQHMLNADFNKDFFSIILPKHLDYILIDFLEERYDIIEYNNNFYTKSEAFDEAEHNINNFRVISRYSEECYLLWKSSIISFIEKLKSKFNPQNIVLVENYLSEEYGDFTETKQYENIEQIRLLNKVLRLYYDYFKDNFKQIKVIEAYKCKAYFTDKNFRYGMHPWHLNEEAYRNIANIIADTIKIEST